MRLTSAAPRVVVAALVLGGCEPVTPPNADLVVDTFVGELAEAACAWQVGCCSPVELEQNVSGRYATKPACLPFARLELDKAVGPLRASLKHNLVAFDGAAAAACIETMKARPCNVRAGVSAQSLSFTQWLQACPQAFVGNSPANGICPLGVECAAGLRCVGGAATVTDAGVLGPTEGLCRPYQGRDDACQSDADCRPTDFCRHPDFHCAERPAEGKACGQSAGAFDPFAPRGLQVACAAGLVCETVAQTCGHLPREGQTCSTSATPCDPDPALALACVGVGFNGAGVCESAGKAGDACGASGLPPCGPKLACLAATGAIGACGAPPAEGQPCAAEGACESPARCDSSSNRCVTPGPRKEDEPCQRDADCETLACLPILFDAAGNALLRCSVPVTFGGTFCTGGNLNFGSGGPGPSFDGGAGVDAPIFFRDAGAGSGADTDAAD